MKIASFVLVTLVGVSATGTCVSGNPETPSDAMSDIKIYKNGDLCSHTGGATDCSAELAKTQTSPNSACTDYPAWHTWPLGDTTQCHGWSSVENDNGKFHENSATNIRCSCDGTKLLYTQYGGTTACDTNPTDKQFELNVCAQGYPENLYDTALDLSCCPVNSPGCTDDIAAAPTNAESSGGKGGMPAPTNAAPSPTNPPRSGGGRDNAREGAGGAAGSDSSSGSDSGSGDRDPVEGGAVVESDGCDGYTSPNSGKCMPFKRLGQYCNIVQKCGESMECTDNACSAFCPQE